MANTEWKDCDVTKEEFSKFTEAFKNDDFRKMFIDYCEELNDPATKKQYESEIVELEAERGVDVTFINPEPGFVVKTSVDGNTKAFLNISKCDRIAKPTSTSSIDEHQKRGLTWSIPFSQAPPRRDLDNRGVVCLVYDVVFHPDAIYLAGRNASFKKLVIDTACDAVESSFSVSLDRMNLKFPKLLFKGTARPTIVRKRNDKAGTAVEPSVLDKICPPLPTVEKEQPIPQSKSKTPPKSGNTYATPKYMVTHRRDVDLQECTYARDASLTAAIPKELVIAIDLPLLNSSKSVSLDVSTNAVNVQSEQPAKYKLNVSLPYPVAEKKGTAKFDKSTRQLVLTLPVLMSSVRAKFGDLSREDSGVESDHGSPKEEEAVFEHLDDKPISFLDEHIDYVLPTFTCNRVNNTIAFTLHVKNVDPTSITSAQNEPNCLHLKFASIGAGFFPMNFAFFVRFAETQRIVSVGTEAWDNNVITQIELADNKDVEVNSTFWTGLKDDGAQLTEHSCGQIVEVAIEPERSVDELEVLVSCTDEETIIDICPTKKTNPIDVIGTVAGDKKGNTKASKKQHQQQQQQQQHQQQHQHQQQPKKGKTKKVRSFSESAFDDLKVIVEHEMSKNETASVSKVHQKTPSLRMISRSLSESDGSGSLKSILKRRTSYDRSMSECSLEEGDGGSSLEVIHASFGGIPEESDTETGLSESCKKTVHFNDHIRKQLYRLNSSILGQRRLNQLKRMRKRAHERKLSESEHSENEDRHSHNTNGRTSKKQNSKGRHKNGGTAKANLNGRPSQQQPLASSEEPALAVNNDSSDLDFKSGMIFNIEM